MVQKFKSLFALSPWYVKVLLGIVAPIVLIVWIMQKVANVKETFNRGKFNQESDKFKKKDEELKREEARTEGALDESKKQKEREKKKVDSEDGDDLSDYFDDK